MEINWDETHLRHNFFKCCCPTCGGEKIINPGVHAAAKVKFQEMINLLKQHTPDNTKWITRMEERFDYVVDFIAAENWYPMVRIIELWPNNKFYPIL